MFDVLSLKTEADRLMSLPGIQKGSVLKSHLLAVKEHCGEEGLKKVEKGLNDLGYSANLADIKPMQKCPEGQAALVSLLCQKLLNYSDNDIIEQGLIASKLSFFTQLVMRNFLSSEYVFKNASWFWKKHVSVGELECAEYNAKEKFAILRLKNYAFHPVVCLSLIGYFAGMFSYLQPNTQVQEIQCSHKGDAYHEFKLTWK